MSDQPNDVLATPTSEVPEGGTEPSPDERGAQPSPHERGADPSPDESGAQPSTAEGGDQSSAEEHMATVRRRRGKGGSLEFNFSEQPLEDDAPVLVFQHVRKTAGTSLRHTLRAGLGGRHVYRDAPEDSRILAEWHKAYYEQLAPEDRRALRYVGGHTAGYFIPLIERPVRAITMVREPIDQVLSRYFFMRERTWTLADLCSDLDLREKLSYFNAQSRALLAPHVDLTDMPDSADDPAAQDWRRLLSDLLREHYMLGVQDRFDASVAMFQTELGLEHRPMRRLRVNEDRPRDADVDQEIRAQLRRLSWLDEMLYERAVAEMDHYFKDKPPEAQDPANAAPARRKGNKASADPLASSAEVLRELQSIRSSLRADFDSIQEELKEVSVRVKALERKQRQERDDKRAAAAGAQEAQARRGWGPFRRSRETDG